MKGIIDANRIGITADGGRAEEGNGRGARRVSLEIPFVFDHSHEKRQLKREGGRDAARAYGAVSQHIIRGGIIKRDCVMNNGGSRN